MNVLADGLLVAVLFAAALWCDGELRRELRRAFRYVRKGK